MSAGVTATVPREDGRSGADYLAGLAGRRLYVAGRPVEDVIREPGLEAMARVLADLVDATQQPGTLATGNGVPWAYTLAADDSQLRARGRAFEETARRSGGLLGRSPDFLATILTAWYGAADYFGDRADALRAYWAGARSRNLVLTHAISDPPGDRYGMATAPIQALRAVGETDEGVVVRGAKMLATLAPFADDLLVYPFRPLTDAEEDQALLFSVPVGTPGLTLYCRPSLAVEPASDHPFAARFDEMDAIVFFDDVTVPWDRVFIHRDVRRANGLRAGTGMTAYAWHQSAVRAWVKAELIFELAAAAATAAGRDAQQVVRQQLGELAGIVETFRALVVSAEAGARQDDHGHVIADPVPLGASGMLNATLYPRAIELLQLITSSGLVVHPLTADDGLDSPAHHFYRHYFGGAGVDGAGHGRLLRAAADLSLDRFGSRQVLYERVFLGPPDAFRAKFFEQYRLGRPPSGMVGDLVT